MLITFPERQPGRTVALIGLAFAIAYGASLFLLQKPGGRIVVGDAVHYYVYLRSLVFDRDLHFQNDYVRLYDLRGGELGAEWIYEATSTGYVRNLMSVGPSLAWAPMFIAVALVVAIGHAALGWQYPQDGFGRLFQASAGFSGILAAALGAWLAYRMTARVYGQRLGIWATLGIWLGSSAIYYSLVSPTYSHAVSMLAASGLFSYWVASRSDQTPRRYVVVGALIGATSLVRWQDAVFLIVPLIEVVQRMQDFTASEVRRALVRLAITCAAAAAVFLPQVLTWIVLYGEPLALPQGQGFMRWTSPQVLNVLLSDWHGLFTWTPIVALAVCGLVWLYRDDRYVGAPMAAAFVVSVYANGAVADWWAGEAFGARRLVSCFPIFVMGLAAFLRRFEERPVALVSIVGLFVLLNGLLLLQYQAFMHGLRDLAPYPDGFYGLVVARFLVPFKLIAWLAGRF